jgi:hypothetical protein
LLSYLIPFKLDSSSISLDTNHHTLINEIQSSVMQVMNTTNLTLTISNGIGGSNNTTLEWQRQLSQGSTKGTMLHHWGLSSTTKWKTCLE